MNMLINIIFAILKKKIELIDSNRTNQSIFPRICSIGTRERLLHCARVHYPVETNSFQPFQPVSFPKLLPNRAPIGCGNVPR